MTKNNKGRSGGDRPTPKTSDSRNHTATDPLIGWFNLAKPSRNRQMKRGWKRDQRGAIDMTLAGHLALLLVLLALIAAEVMA